MLKKRSTSVILILILTAATFFASCEKEDTTDFVNQATITSKLLDIDIETIRLSMLFHKAIYDTALLNHDTAYIDSALVTLSSNSYTNDKVFTFDYGEGQIGPDWKNRSGKIIADFSTSLDSSDFYFNANLDNYRFETYVMRGQLFLTSSENNAPEESSFISVTNLQSYNADGDYFEQYNHKNYTWTKGVDEPYNWQDHEFLVSGGADADYQKDGDNSSDSNTDLSIEIIDDWFLRLSCGKIIKSGTLEVVFETSTVKEIFSGDFDDTDLDGCSDKVILKNSDNYGYPFYF